MKGAPPSGLSTTRKMVTRRRSHSGGPTFSALVGMLFLLWFRINLLVRVASLRLPSIPKQRHHSHNNNNNKDDHSSNIQYEVIGGSGRIGSQFLRLLAPQAVALPRGVCPGSLTTNDNDNNNNNYNNPILICTPASAWKGLYEQTLPERRGDLVFCGNGLLPRSLSTTVTQVIPHYAVQQVGVCASVQSTAPPTYLFGKHAKTVQSWLHRDCILNTEILDTPTDLRIKAAQKILWASCLWVLCHVQRERPLTVGQVYEEHVEILVGLVHELWPAFQSLLLVDTDETKEENISLPTFPKTLQYLQDYSLSIPDAVPSLDLAVSELRDRNGLLAAPNQPLHRSLLEQVVGAEAVEIVFGDSTSSGVDDKNNDNSSSAFDSSVTLDLRETAGIAVHGIKTTTNTVRDISRRQQQSTPKKNIVVVGSGILGASVAYHLALQQRQQQQPNSIPCNITVVSEQINASDVTPTTRASWAWLNANPKEPLAYQQLNCLGMHAWRHHALLRDLPRWCGSLGAQQTEAASTQHAASTTNKNNTAGYFAYQEGPLPEEDWRALEPQVEFATATETTTANPTMAQQQQQQQQQKPKGMHSINGDSSGETESTPRPAADIAVHSSLNEGCVDPTDAVQRLRQAADELGVTFVWNQNVTRILYENEYNSDNVTGIECCELLEDKDNNDNENNNNNNNNEATPQQKTTLEADLVVVAAAGSTALAGLPMLHNPGGVMAFSQKSPSTSDSQQQQQDERLSKIIVDAVGESHLPAVGFVCPGVYTVVAHSGMTLAPLLGSLAATEILASCKGTATLDLDLLAPYRPTRFLAEDPHKREDKLKFQLPSFQLSFPWDK